MSNHGRQLSPKLYAVSWLGMTPPMIDCHVYVLRGSDGLLLIDCGTPWSHGRILENMRQWGLDPNQIRTILLTHSHVDHVSGGYLFKRPGVEILGHREIATAVECQWETALGKDGEPFDLRMDGFLLGGEKIGRCGFDIEVIATPGHTKGCLSYLTEVDGARCLFTGDLLMSNRFPGWHGDPGFCEAELLESIRRLSRIEFRHLCHGHDALLDDCGRLFRDTLAAVGAGAWHAPGSPLLAPIPGRQLAS